MNTPETSHHQKIEEKEEIIKKIELTNFARRHWENDFTGAKIVGISPDELIDLCNKAIKSGAELKDGYAPFCKHLFLKNPSETRCGFTPTTPENISNLKSGYVARRESELPVLEQWLEDVNPPRAVFLDIILYSREQLEAEADEHSNDKDVPNAEWGIVNILGTLTPEEIPMPPITQLRNALGKSEGGSGVPLNRESYMKAVEFWNHHAAVKS